MNRAQRRKLPKNLQQKPQVLDITARHAADIGVQQGDITVLTGFRRSATGGAEKCPKGQETPFRVNVVG